MKYMRIPTVVDAVQYTEYGKLVHGMCNSQSCFVSGNNRPHVHTMHNSQMVVLEIGDYILPEPDGVHFYPCKEEIFKKTYKPFIEEDVSKSVSVIKSCLENAIESGFEVEVVHGALKAMKSDPSQGISEAIEEGYHEWTK